MNSISSARQAGASALELGDFCRIFGAEPHEFSEQCRREIRSRDFRHVALRGLEREAVLLRVLQKIDSAELTISGPAKLPQWEAGWSENLADYKKSRNTDDLVPKFIRKDEVIRLCGEYIRPLNPNFETDFVAVLRIFLFEKYFSNSRNIFEFGCGTGHNLVALSELFPDVPIHGLDWAQSATELIDELAADLPPGRLTSHLFDVFKPNFAVEIPERSAVLTIGTMEQLGTDFGPFLEFLLKKRPQIVLHVETLFELYDQGSLFDYVAARYLQRRNWLRGYLKKLRELEALKSIEIIKCQRTFGSLFHDGYSYLAWKPI